MKPTATHQLPAEPGFATRNLLIAAALAGVQVFQLVVLPFALRPADASWGWLILPCAACTLSLWAVIHECIHGHLSRDQRLNHRVGRLLSILFGAPYRPMRLAHLLHHKFNRGERDRVETYDATRRTWWQAAPGYYFNLLIGLYLSSVSAVFLFLLPVGVVRAIGRRLGHDSNVIGLLADRLTEPAALREVRMDALLVIAVYGTSAWLFGVHAWMLIGIVLLRGLIISLHDSAYHYATALGPSAPSLCLRLPDPLSAGVLHFNYHDVHHRRPDLACWQLPAQFERDAGRFDLGFASAVVRQFKGPVAVQRLPYAEPADPPGTTHLPDDRQRRA